MEIKGFLEASFVDWPGRVCAVLFLPGCNLRCPFCHNHELALYPQRLETYPWEYIHKRLGAMRGWLDGVCLTGGEPTLHRDLPELLEAVHRRGLLTKLDTNGTRPEVLRFLVARKLVDYIAMDVKAPLEPLPYNQCAGTEAPLEAIKESIRFLLSDPIPYEFRTTVVPRFHSPEVIARMGGELKGARRWIRQDFNPANALEPGLGLPLSEAANPL